MALAGQAVMINWSNVAVAQRARYRAWHDTEHISGRLGIPGFLRGRRHLAIDADRDIFNLYEVRALEVLTGDAYRAKTNSPSAETRAVAPFITDAIRALAHVTYSSGIGVGAFVQTLRFGAEAGAETALSAFLCETALPALAGLADIVGTHLCVADQAASAVVSDERRGRPTRIPDWAVIVEGTSRVAVRDAVAACLPAASLMRHGAVAEIVTGTYGLEIVVSSADLPG